MQGNKIRLLAGVVLMAASTGYVQAEALQPDPAWQQGTLSNGFDWQVLATPQRPSDRVEIRLLVKTGSLVEGSQETGFSRFIPQIALAHNVALLAQSGSFLAQNASGPRPLPPVIISYDTTQYNLSLPTNRPEELKEALSWLAQSAGQLTINNASIKQANAAQNAIATWPQDTQDGWWRYRLKGSTLLGHDPAQPLKKPLDIKLVQDFYEKWYTPDAMSLIVVGNVEARSISEQINKTFSELKGKRETPAPLPTLSPLRHEAVSIMTNRVKNNRLSIMWDTPWQPIRESAGLIRYWQEDLAREALFWHIQQNLAKSNAKEINLGFDCRVLFGRGQCAINVDVPNGKLEPNLDLVARELEKVKQTGISEEEFAALVAQKKLELQTLFATYARTTTDILMGQRLRSLQNQVVDIAPEQYQKLRQNFLNNLTAARLNEVLRQQLSQEMTLVLSQPEGEPEHNMKDLRARWDEIMSPLNAAPAPTDDNPQDVSDIPAQ